MDWDSRKQNRKNEVRLHKYLADCGLGSRRSCERFIAAGRVSVDGDVRTDMGVCVNPERQSVRVDGKVVHPQKKVYFLFNKPRDVLCTSSDPMGRRTFGGFFKSVGERVYTVGRLDRDSEGLIVVTNDGDLAFRLSHPRHQVCKVYDVWVSGGHCEDVSRRFLSGVKSRGQILKAESVRKVGHSTGGERFRVVLKEGRNRQIRRMFFALGFNVERLKRTALGDLKLGNVRCGAWRSLDVGEVEYLRQLASEREISNR